MRRSSADCNSGFRLACHRSQQRVRELSPNRRSDLRHVLGRTEPVKPRHQRGVQACWDRQSWRRNRGDGSLDLAFALRFQHRLRHFLDEQRNAVGALDNVLPDIRRQRLVPDDAVDDGSDFTLAEPVERSVP